MTDTGEAVADLGYFGPGSVTWRLHAEPVAIVGGLRALLLQALHPGAMAKLVEVSDFHDDPWGRLARTVDYVGVLSFGSRAEAERTAARVRGIHRRLGVDDPEQMAWVHVSLVDSFLAVTRAAGIRLAAGEADRYVGEQVAAAELAGVPDAAIVRDVAGLNAFVREIRPRLRATPDARAAARLLVAPPLPVARRYALPARLGWTTVATLAIGLLPGWARRMYLLPPLPGTALVTGASLRALRAATLALPSRYREGPLVREARARARALAADRPAGTPTARLTVVADRPTG